MELSRTSDSAAAAAESSPPQPHCKNCETPLQGEFCHSCGQHDRLYLRNIFAVVGDLFGEIGHYDSRFYRTIVGLLFRPAFLSLEFVRGRHAAYVPPLRLYFLVSLIAFLILGSLIDTPDQQLIETQAKAEQVTTDSEPASTPAEKDTVDIDQLNLNLSFLNAEDQAFVQAKLEYLLDNPRVLRQRLLSLAPQMMLVMLPFFALYLKLLYLFRKRYYLEHLTVCLHTHAFILLSITLIFLVELASSQLSRLTGWSIINETYAWLEQIAFIWIPAYLLFTQKLFYQQSWPLTLWKFLLTMIGYLVLLAIAFIALLIIGVLTA